MSNISPKPGEKRGRKPVHLVAATGYCDPQDAVWAGVRKLRTFSVFKLMGWLLNNGQDDVNEGTVVSYLLRLERAKYISLTATEINPFGRKIHSYKLENDTGVHAPRLTKAGLPSTQGLGHRNLWRSMKMLKSFTARELAESASTEERVIKLSEARDYILYLKKAGYFRLIKSEIKQSRAQSRYSLLPHRNTGPRPPMIQRIKRVFDPNLNQIMAEEV